MRPLFRGCLTIIFPKGSPAAAQGLNNTNVLGGLNYPSNRGALKIAESKIILLIEAQHLKVNALGALNYPSSRGTLKIAKILYL